VFIVGCARSGTTLLYHMLQSSGAFVRYSWETHLFNRVGPRFGSLATRKNRERLLASWQQSKFFSRSGVDVEVVRRRVISECSNVGDFLRIVMETLASAQNVERWAEKTPDHVLHIEEIKRTLPNAIFIHIIRDGRDVALSMERQHWVRPFFWDHHYPLLVCGIYWEWLLESGRKAGSRLGADYMELRFEDLVENASSVLTEVGDFIGEKLNYAQIQRTRFGSLAAPNSSFKDRTEEEGEFNPVGRWKLALSADQVRSLEALLGPTLHAIGCETVTAPGEWGEPGLRRLRALYRAYFSLRLWAKCHLPGSNYFVKDRYVFDPV
jgi:hypothetical protein